MQLCSEPYFRMLPCQKKKKKVYFPPLRSLFQTLADILAAKPPPQVSGVRGSIAHGFQIYLIRLLGCPSGVRHALKRSPTARSASMPARSRGSRPPPVWTAWRGFPPLALLYKASLGWMGLRRVSHLPFLLDEACSSSRGEASVVSSCTLSLAWQ